MLLQVREIIKKYKAYIDFYSAVATGFPSGQTPLHLRLEEIKYAVSKGAKEIDIVINRPLVITGKWQELYQEIQQMKEACGPKAHMKAILATGELGSMENVSLNIITVTNFNL